MKNLLLLALSTFILTSANAQFFEAENYDWENPEYAEREADDSLDVFFILNKRLYNYHFVDDAFVQDELVHRQVYLNSPDGIEEFNKIYIPTGGEYSELLSFKARAIKGENIKVVNEDAIKTGTYEETDQEYTYAAIDGLEVGTIVEYFYIVREPAAHSGISLEYQYDFPVERFELDIISPDHLEFAGKVYNLKDSVQTDTVIEEQNRIFLHTDNVPAFAEETNTFSDALYGKVIFKLDKNLYTGDRNVTSYSSVAQNVVDFINKDLSRGEEKAVEKLFKKSQKESPDFLTAAQKVDHYLKTEFNFISSGSFTGDLDEIIDYQAISSSSGLQLYCALFRAGKIDFQVIYTSNRSNMKFDPEFQVTNFLNDILIYIPNDDMYLDFSDATARNGVINYMLTGTDALFISEMTLNDNTVAVSELDEIPYREAKYSADTLKVKVNFSENLQDNTLQVDRAITGYVARQYQPVFDLITDEEDRLDYTETLISYVDADADVEDISFENNAGEYLGYKPLRAHATLKNSEFIQTAGPDFLFNLGQLIGPQAELYNEDSVRVFDIENPFSRLYYRTIIFTVPEGFELANPKKAEIEKVLEIEGEEMARFESRIEQKGREYTVTVYEYYEGLMYSKNLFKPYSEVINAAADFNKVSLLLKRI